MVLVHEAKASKQCSRDLISSSRILNEFMCLDGVWMLVFETKHIATQQLDCHRLSGCKLQFFRENTILFKNPVISRVRNPMVSMDSSEGPKGREKHLRPSAPKHAPPTFRKASPADGCDK